MTMGVCPQHCPRPGGGLAQAAAMIVVAGVAVSVVVSVLTAAAPFLAAAAAVVAVLAVPVVLMVRRSRRLAVVRWPSQRWQMPAKQAREQVALVRARPVRRVFEAPKVRVVPA